jgi:hypothetical protein
VSSSEFSFFGCSINYPSGRQHLSVLHSRSNPHFDYLSASPNMPYDLAKDYRLAVKDLFLHLDELGTKIRGFSRGRQPCGGSPRASPEEPSAISDLSTEKLPRAYIN